VSVSRAVCLQWAASRQYSMKRLSASQKRCHN